MKKPVVNISQVSALKEKALGGGIEGAEQLSRETMNWRPAMRSPDQAINSVKPMADARSRDMAQNDGFTSGAVAIHKDSIVGACYRLNATPDWRTIGATEEWADEFTAIVEARFGLIAESNSCWLDASRRNTLTGMVRLAVGGFCMTGEVLGTAEWIKETRRPVSTCIQLISPDRLSNPNGSMDTPTLRRGVARDGYGRSLGYHIRLAYPSEMSDARSLQWRYIKAEKPWGRRQVIHIVEQMSPDQTRGIADMVAALKQMRMTKQFQEVTLQNAVINASYAAAIESEIPEIAFQQLGADAGGYQNVMGQYLSAMSGYLDGSKNITIDGAKIPHLFPGTKLSMKPMGTPGGVGTQFEESLLRHTAAALGLSYEEFARDFTKTNYSSARASMANTWKFMQSRKKTVADRTATEIYALVLEEMIANGDVPMPPGMDRGAFYLPLMKEAFTSCSWIGASRGQVDELKETQAAILRIASGLSTYEIESGRLGLDFRQLFEQQAREKKAMAKYGLTHDLSASKSASLNPTNQGSDQASQDQNQTADQEA